MQVKGRVRVDVKIGVKEIEKRKPKKKKGIEINRDLVTFEYEDVEGVHEIGLAPGDNITLSIPIEFDTREASELRDRLAEAEQVLSGGVPGGTIK